MNDARQNGTPPWVRMVGMAIWVTGPDGRICYFNRMAEDLLERRAEDCLGNPCHQIIGGLAPTGLAHCGLDCPIVHLARRDAEIEPFELRVPIATGETRSLQVIAIPARWGRSATPHIVHCAQPLPLAWRAERFVRRVATRTRVETPAGDAGRDSTLTPREREILELLASDETLHSIAAKLHISHATVRNHVQHILSRMRAHSILEAVAYYLLEQSN